MSAFSSSPRGERAGRTGTGWEARLVRTEHLVADGAPEPVTNRAARRALQRAEKKRPR